MTCTIATASQRQLGSSSCGVSPFTETPLLKRVCWRRLDHVNRNDPIGAPERAAACRCTVGLQLVHPLQIG